MPFSTPRIALLVFLCLLFVRPDVRAQAQVDSLEQVLRQATGAGRIPVLHDLTRALRGPDPDEARQYIQQALDLYPSSNNDSLHATGLLLLGTIHMRTAQFDSAVVRAMEGQTLAQLNGDSLHLAHALLLRGDANFRLRNYEAAVDFTQDANTIFEQLADSMGQSMASLSLGNLQNNLGNYAAALGYYEVAANIQLALGDDTRYATIRSNMGVANRRQGDYAKAIENYLQALEIFEAQNASLRSVNVVTNLGVLYYFLNEFEEALEFHTRALALNKALDRPDGIANARSNQGVVFNELGRFEEALEAHREAMALEGELGDKEGVANALNNIGLVYFNQRNYEEALHYYDESLIIKREIGNPEIIVNTLHNLVDVHREMTDDTEAFLVGKEALEIAEKTRNMSLIRDSQQKLSALYEASGQFEEALTAYKAYKTAHDSLFNSNSQSVIAEMQTRYRSREKEQTIALLEEEKTNQQLWIGILLLGLVLIAAVALLGYNGYRIKKRALQSLDAAYENLKTTQAQLIQREKLASLGQLTAGIAHELNNPLNFVNNFSQLNKEMIDEVAAHDALPALGLKPIIEDIRLNQHKILEHGQQANQIVRSMMKHAQEGSGKKQQAAFNSLVDEYLNFAQHGARLQYEALQLEIDRQYDTDIGLVNVIPHEIGQVVINLFNNACDAIVERASAAGTPAIGNILVSTQRSQDAIIVQISDDGAGIPEAMRKDIFVPFFTTKAPGMGVGLGLSISHDIVTQAYGGTLVLSEADASGATFTLTFPDARVEHQPVGT
ncbi:MAG: tetratricopeptide repeat protein [Bacteroidota bacterium]